MEIWQNSQENACASAPFLIKLETLACNCIKKGALAEVFSCEFREMYKTTFSQNTSGRLLL